MAQQKQEFLNVAGSIIGLLLVGILGFLAWALVFIRVPQENREAMNWLMAILSAQVGIVVGFYFGNSVGSKKQTETIDKMADATRHVVQTANPTPSIPVAPGESVTVEGKE